MDLRSLSYDRFLNVVYRSMVMRLDYDPKEPEKTRREFDRVVAVDGWRTPWTRDVEPRDRDDVPASAPTWWRGDEDASQSFLAAMGVVM